MARLHEAWIIQARIVPHRGGRNAHTPHVKTFRDGWRTLRSFPMCSPRWPFLTPGMVLILLGLLGYALVIPRAGIGNLAFGAHTPIFASLAIIWKYQSNVFAMFTETFAIGEQLMPAERKIDRLCRCMSLQGDLILGCASLLLGRGCGSARLTPGSSRVLARWAMGEQRRE